MFIIVSYNTAGNLLVNWVSRSEKHWVKSVQIRSFFCSVFSRIRTEYGGGKIRTRKTSVFWHFSRSETWLLTIFPGKSTLNKTPVLNKSIHLGSCYIKSTFYEDLKLKQNFLKKKLVTGKTLFFLDSPFYVS